MNKNKIAVVLITVSTFLLLSLSDLNLAYSAAVAPIISQNTEDTEKANVEVYPAPSGIASSSQYSIEILQGAKSYNSFVYQIQNPAFLANGQPSGLSTSSTLEETTAWTTFSTNTNVIVKVTNTKPFQSVRILPSHAGIISTINGNTVSFPMTFTGQQQVAVDFCYTSRTCDDTTDTNITNPLLVFANPLQAEPSRDALIAKPGAAVPPLSGQSMIFFGPGVYNLGTTPYVLGSNQTALLAGGAYVKGSFALANGATNTTIEGRGILSGENIPQSSCPVPRVPATCPIMITGSNIVGNVTVRGITLINSPFYNISLYGVHNIVHNVKIMSWSGNNDGVNVARSADPEGSFIEDSFFKTGDDAVKLFSSNLTVRRCTLWQLDNAAPFEMGANLKFDQSNITVQDSDVIRTEADWPNRDNAIFSADLGGNANVSNYTFENIRVENSDWQLFQIAEVPNAYTSLGNNSLGSISNLLFKNIQVTDTQILPNLFQGFDAEHRVSNIAFQNATVAGQRLSNPAITFNANRNFSLGGTVFSSFLRRNSERPENFEVSLFSGATGDPSLSTTSIDQPELSSSFEAQAIGDFYGDGNASVLFLNTATRELGIWKDPIFTNGQPWKSQYFPLEGAGVRIEEPILNYKVAGVGDFNGDGHTDILFWGTTSGVILLMNGSTVTKIVPIQPGQSSNWRVAGIGDLNQAGYSDIVLRDDTNGNVEILYFGAGGMLGSVDLTSSSFFYSSTAHYNSQWPAVSGHLDTSWSIAGVGDFSGQGYADILWVSYKGQIAVTRFVPQKGKTVIVTQVFAQIPSSDDQIITFGDYNGDGVKDIVLYNPMTKLATLWYMGWNSGDLYKVGPSFSPASGYSLVQ